jgi:beta-galactosidase
LKAQTSVNRFIAFCILLATWAGLPCTCLASLELPAPRERSNFDEGWRFAFGHPFDPEKDFNHGTNYFSYFTKAGYGDGPADPKFDASSWRELELPHDWAVEAPFDGKGSHSHGYKAVGRNFPERSVGWYRKTFEIPASELGRRIGIEFDGVHRDSLVWVNGFFLGRQHSGSTSFRYDITDYLNYGGTNAVAVRVDVTMEEGWYYEGAGIYRHVWLTKTAPLHVAPWGTFVTSHVRDDFSKADVTALASIANDGMAPATFQLEQTILGPDGGSIATKTLSELSLAPGEASEFSVVLPVAQPLLWSVESPTLHRLLTIVRDTAGAVVDRYETPFGIRTLRWDPNEGFFLNGRHVLLKGTNNHQDHAGVGVAVPDALWEFRIRRLKEFGSNAYRCAHHPPAPELLDACDRLGMLVIDENRVMGANPEQLAPLEAMIRRDRNHPSVILWSVGNEEWSIEGNEKGARLAATMQAHARRLDPSRRTSVAISGGWGVGASTTADVMGYNYFTHGSTDDQHSKFPHQPGVVAEETTDQGTRGVYFGDKARAHQIPPAKGDSGGNVKIGWQHLAARPYLAGLFYWTGFDYRGESNPFGFPAVSSQYGIMDTCGFPKDQYYFLKSWWTDEPVLHVFPHWNWPDKIGRKLAVGCYSNHEAVELFLNGASLGKKDMPHDGHLEWQVVYQPGVLEAHGYRDDNVVQTLRVETTGAPTKLVLAPDRRVRGTDGADVAVIAVSTIDAQGRHVPTANQRVTFAVTGGRIIGVGNGDPSCHESDKGSERSLFNGYAQVIVQAARDAGEIRLHARADDLVAAEAVILSSAGPNPVNLKK